MEACAKLRALRAKNVLTCQHALRAYVLTCLASSRGNVSCVLTCLRALRVYVLTCQRASFDVTIFSFAANGAEVGRTVRKV